MVLWCAERVGERKGDPGIVGVRGRGGGVKREMARSKEVREERDTQRDRNREKEKSQRKQESERERRRPRQKRVKVNQGVGLVSGLLWEQ